MTHLFYFLTKAGLLNTGLYKLRAYRNLKLETIKVTRTNVTSSPDVCLTVY